MTGGGQSTKCLDMQQTALDHYLKEQFVYVYHISVTKIPRRVPLGISVLPAPRGVNDRRWGFILRCDNLKAYNTTIAYIRAERMLYSANIKEKQTFLSRLFNPRNQSSFTYNALWTSVRMAVGYFFITTGMKLVPSVGIGRLIQFAGNTVAAFD